MTTEERTKFYVDSVKPRLIELGARMCNAIGMDDWVLHEVAYEELVQFYEDLSANGYWHPWLTEALGDFCQDDKRALGFYQRALEQVTALNGPRHTILLGMAQSYFELGQHEQAEACFSEGKAAAVSAKDEDSIRQAREIENVWLNAKK